MEHPLYSLSEQPETSAERSRDGKNWLAITASGKGLDMVYDKGTQLYSISQNHVEVQEISIPSRLVFQIGSEFLS